MNSKGGGLALAAHELLQFKLTATYVSTLELTLVLQIINNI